MKKVCFFVFLLAFIFTPLFTTYALYKNTGFVSQSIWYSKDTLEEGDKVKIYTFVFNPDSRELSGIVLFFDKTVLLGKQNFTVSPKKAEEVSIDWTVTAGAHQIFAKIESAKFLVSQGKYEEVYLPSSETPKSSIKISPKTAEKIVDTLKEKIISSAEKGKETTDSLTEKSVEKIKNIADSVTPEIIKNPILTVVTKLEETRDNVGEALAEKKEEIKMELENLDASKKTESESPVSTIDEQKNPEKIISNKNIQTKDKNAEEKEVIKPVKQVELILYSILSFILDNKFFFYGTIVAILFFVGRFVLMNFL